MEEIKHYSREDVERTVRNAIERQILGRVPIVRASEQWARILQMLPADLLPDALALALATERYQPVPRCHCCGR